jgi:hypothetical protein
LSKHKEWFVIFMLAAFCANTFARLLMLCPVRLLAFLVAVVHLLAIAAAQPTQAVAFFAQTKCSTLSQFPALCLFIGN